MTVADMARAAAVHCEGKWHALRRDNKTGDWLMTFTIATTDFPALVRDASPGQRFMLALVAIGDNETPIGGEDGPVAATSQPDDGDAASPAAAPAKLKFSRTREAGMLCKDAAFQQWLQTYWPVNWMNAVEHARDPAKPDSIAAAFVHHWCGVTSRTELDNVNFIIHGRWDELATRFMQETGRMAVDR